MSKSLFRSIALYGIGDFLVTGVSAFLLIPIYLEYLTVEDYGSLNVMNNNTLLFTYVFQFGIVSAFSRIYYLKKNEGNLDQYVWSVLWIHIIYSLFLAMLFYVFRQKIFGTLAPTIQDNKLLFYPILMAFFSFLPAIFFVILRINGNAFKFVQYQILNVLFILIFIGSFVIFGTLNLKSILVGFVSTNFLIWILTTKKLLKRPSYSIDWKSIKETIMLGGPLFIGYMSYFFMAKYSLIVLQGNVTNEELGLFSLANQIGTIPALISVAVTKAIQPFLYASNNAKELQMRGQSFDSLYKLVMIWVCASIIFIVDIVFEVLPKSYLASADITKWFLFVTIIYHLSVTENTVLLYFMKSKYLLLITVLGSIVNVLSANILVVEFGINGILFSMFLAFILTVLLQIILSSRLIKIVYQWSLIAVFLIVIVSYLIISTTNWNSYLSGYSNFYALFCFLFLTILLLLKLRKNDFVIRKYYA